MCFKVSFCIQRSAELYMSLHIAAVQDRMIRLSTDLHLTPYCGCDLGFHRGRSATSLGDVIFSFSGRPTYRGMQNTTAGWRIPIKAPGSIALWLKVAASAGLRDLSNQGVLRPAASCFNIGRGLDT